ncbi:adenosine receptor A2a-like [Coregonus clupeaformis]|uniref:adenosine receptor A2a-like n=1 Tax=Coregonus clupeaformis TaxID=59861 RepID=UPI001E1C6B2A|nr:adenosine receptor A2a-like [Coregonus clupeaformis]
MISMNISTRDSCDASQPSSSHVPVPVPVPVPGITGPYIAAELLIALLAIAGNILVCLAVTLNRKLRTVTNYFLVSLAVADIFVGVLAIPCAVLTDLGQPRHNLPLCLLLLSVLIVLTQSSILSLLAVAAERYVAILLPLQYQRIVSPRNARLALVLTWCLALLSGSIPLMGWHGSLPPSGACLFTCVVNLSYMVYFNFFGCVLVPLVVMFIIYGHIFVTVRQQLRRIAAGRGPARPDTRDGGRGPARPDTRDGGRGPARPDTRDDGSGSGSRDAAAGKRARVEAWGVSGVAVWEGAGNKGSEAEGWSGNAGVMTSHASGCVSAESGSVVASEIKSESRGPVKTRCGSGGGECKRALRMRREVRKATSLFLVLFLFMLCWLPIHFLNCVMLLCPRCHVPLPLSLAAILLSHANSALNPLLYAYRMRSFRHALRTLCCTHTV